MLALILTAIACLTVVAGFFVAHCFDLEQQTGRETRVGRVLRKLTYVD